MHMNHLDAFEFDTALDVAEVLHKWPGSRDTAAMYAVHLDGRDGILIAHPEGGGGVLIEQNASDEISTHDMIRDAKRRGLF